MTSILLAALLSVSPSDYYSGLESAPVPASVYYAGLEQPKAATAPAKKLAVVVPSNASEPPKPKGHHYPVRGGHWSVNGDWTPSKGELVRHLMDDGTHKGKFTRAYLEGLSREELLSLHDDDHEWRLQTQYLPVIQRSYQYSYQSACPGGRCPTPTTRRRR